MVIAHTMLGLAMLLFGRKLFWLSCLVGAGAIAMILGVALQYTHAQFAIGPIIDERN